jgi:hypothetical protein
VTNQVMNHHAALCKSVCEGSDPASKEATEGIFDGGYAITLVQ